MTRLDLKLSLIGLNASTMCTFFFTAVSYCVNRFKGVGSMPLSEQSFLASLFWASLSTGS